MSQHQPNVVRKWVLSKFLLKSVNWKARVCVCVCVCVCVQLFSHVQLFATLWTVACQSLLSMGFSKQEYWSELPFPPPGDLPNPGIEPALAGGLFISLPPGKPRKHVS